METGCVRVAFSSTAYGPLWRPAMDTWLRVIAYTQRALIEQGLGQLSAVGITDRMYTHSAQNRLVQDFLDAEPRMTHLFHTESDMLLPDDCIMQLLALKKSIASGVYFLRNGNGQPCLYRRTLSMGPQSYGMTPVNLYPQDTPFLLRGCPGLGCVLFEREVFERLPFPWFDLKESTYGSDLYFYTNALKEKIETWVDPRVKCGQIEYKVWEHGDYVKRLKDDPEFGKAGFIMAAPPEGEVATT